MRGCKSQGARIRMTPQEKYDRAIQLATQGYAIDLEALRKKLNIPFEQTNPKVEWHEEGNTEELRKRCRQAEINRYGNSWLQRLARIFQN